MALDYVFTQKLIDFGRGLAGSMVGQPFVVYRLNNQSNGDVVSAENVVNSSYRAKITRTRKTSVVENEYLHVNPFEFVGDSSEVQVGDILVQADDVYGGDSAYAVATKRPLKPLVCVRVESSCRIYRPYSGDKSRGSYSQGSPVSELRNPFVLSAGEFTIGTYSQEASVVPCGVQSIGQLKGLQAERLPVDTITAWWFLYIPFLPGLERLRPGDVVEVLPYHPQELSRKFRIHTEYTSIVGLVGHFLAAEQT